MQRRPIVAIKTNYHRTLNNCMVLSDSLNAGQIRNLQPDNIFLDDNVAKFKYIDSENIGKKTQFFSEQSFIGGNVRRQIN